MNITLTAQFSPAAKVLPQVVVFEKSPAFAPIIPICQRCSVDLPLLVTVTLCGLLPRVKLAGERLTAVPTPVRMAV
jgi:hypothetical protein